MRKSGNFELVGAEADAVGAVAETGVEPGGLSPHAAGMLHRAVLLFDPDDIERRIGKYLGNAHGVGMAVDLRGLAGLQHLTLPHADGAAAQQQCLRWFGGGVDEDRAGGLEDARQFGAQFLPRPGERIAIRKYIFVEIPGSSNEPVIQQNAPFLKEHRRKTHPTNTPEICHELVELPLEQRFQILSKILQEMPKTMTVKYMMPHLLNCCNKCEVAI